MSFLKQTPISRTIEPNHIEMALYAASIELASARGVEVSRVRIYTQGQPLQTHAGRFFDGMGWIYLWSGDLDRIDILNLDIVDFLSNDRHKLSLISWLHFDTRDEMREAIGAQGQGLAVALALPHEWRRLFAPWPQANGFIATKIVGDICGICQTERLLKGETAGEPWKNYKETVCKYEIKPWARLPF